MKKEKVNLSKEDIEKLKTVKVDGHRPIMESVCSKCGAAGFEINDNRLVEAALGVDLEWDEEFYSLDEIIVYGDEFFCRTCYDWERMH